MRRTKIYIVLLLATVFMTNSCKKDEKKVASCDELLSNFTTTFLTFSLAQTEANCNAYKNAIDAYVKGCAILTPSEKAEFQEDMDDLDCSTF